MKRSSAHPQYGVDAPNVMRSMLLIGGAFIGAGSLLRVFPFGRKRLALLSPMLWLIGLIPGFLGLTMVAYAWRGKFQYRDLILEKIRWRGDEEVLDVGTGRGLFMIGAAQHLTTGKAIGIDIWNPNDLSGNRPENAWHNARLAHVEDKIAVLDADARELPFADQRFDVVLSTYCLNNIEGRAERRKACDEIARVLKVGGTAFISDYTNAAEYATALRQAGLSVTAPQRYFLQAHGPMWLVEAKKIRP